MSLRVSDRCVYCDGKIREGEEVIHVAAATATRKSSYSLHLKRGQARLVHKRSAPNRNLYEGVYHVMCWILWLR
jgi:hypothetical protein